jgi:flagellar protein FlgJ
MNDIASVYMTNKPFNTGKEIFAGNNGKVKTREDKELMHACREFESLLVNQILKEMRETVPEGGLFEESNSIKIWESYRDEKLAIQISSGNNNLGLSNYLYDQLNKDSMVSVIS